MSTDSPILIAFGGNLGDVLETFRWAINRLVELGARPQEISRAFKTRPLTVDGGEWHQEVGPPAYWNAACRVETELGPHQLLEVLHLIEREAGRERRERWESRVLDLDLLGYGSKVIDEQGLKVPHPSNGERRFVLMPLSDIVPQWVEPRHGLSVETLLSRLEIDDGEILSVKRHWTKESQ